MHIKDVRTRAKTKREQKEHKQTRNGTNNAGIITITSGRNKTKKKQEEKKQKQ